MIFLMRGVGHAASRTSILPVTAAVINAERRSLRMSMLCFVLAIRASMLAVSWSRKVAMADCSASLGQSKVRFAYLWPLKFAIVLSIASMASCARNGSDFVTQNKNCPVFLLFGRKRTRYPACEHDP